MVEVLAILIACGALVVGLLVLGWAYGDFQKPRAGGSTPPPRQ